MSLAVGVGWMREEFELMGQDFDTRGKRLNEMIPALRALWQGGWVSWSGEYYQVPEMMIEPHPTAPVPILCGGESDAALRRAAAVRRLGRLRVSHGTTRSVRRDGSPPCGASTDARTSRSRSCWRCSKNPRPICTSEPRTSASPR